MVLNLRRTCFQDLLLLDRCFVCCRLVHKKSSTLSCLRRLYCFRRDVNAPPLQRMRTKFMGCKWTQHKAPCFPLQSRGGSRGGYLTPVSPPPVRTRWILEEKDEKLGRGDNEPRQHLKIRAWRCRARIIVGGGSILPLLGRSCSERLVRGGKEYKPTWNECFLLSLSVNEWLLRRRRKWDITVFICGCNRFSEGIRSLCRRECGFSTGEGSDILSPASMK